MQRKRYRDYSTSVELGNALNFVRDSHMRKFTTSRFVKCAILVIVGYIVVSVYLKHRSIKAKFDGTMEMDIPKDRVQENEQKESVIRDDVIKQPDNRADALGQNDNRAGAFGQDDNRPGAFEQNEIRAEEFGKEDNRAGAFQQNDDRAGAFGQNDNRPGEFGQNDKRAGAFGQNDDRAGAFGHNRADDARKGDDRAFMNRVNDNRAQINRAYDNRAGVNRENENRPYMNKEDNDIPNINRLNNNRPFINRVNDNRDAMNRGFDNRANVNRETDNRAAINRGNENIAPINRVDDNRANLNINNREPADVRVKERVNNALFEEYKRQQEENAKKDVFKDQIARDGLNVNNGIPPNKNYIDEVDNYKDEEGKKINVEVVHNINEIEAGDKADFIKVDADFDIDGQQGDEQIRVNQDDNDVAGDNDDNHNKNLDIEIERQIADSFRDAVNEVAEEHVDKIENDYNDEVELEKEEFKGTEKRIAEVMSLRELEHIRKDGGKHDFDHETPPFVTAVRQSTFIKVLNLVYSVQRFVPEQTLHVFDLDLDDEQKDRLKSTCNVEPMIFIKEIFPRYVGDLDNNRWMSLVLQTALAEFGNIVWINPDYEVVSAEFGHLVHHSHQNGATVIAEEMPFSTYAVTNPSMYDFIQVDKDRLRRHKHLEIRAMILHNTPEIAANILRPLTVCSLEEACLQPPGTSKLGCRFDYTGTKYAGCHKNEESALNILFKKHFDFDMELFYKPYPNMFRRFDESMLRIPKLLKICEDDKDLKENRDL